MTTEQEFQKAIEMINICNATILYGCKYDKDYAYTLYHNCKKFIETFDKTGK